MPFYTDHFLLAHKASINLTCRGIPWCIRFAVVQKFLHIFTVLKIAVILSCAIAIAHTCAITYFCADLSSFRVVTVFISLGMLASVGRVTAGRDSSSKYKQGRQKLHDENDEADSWWLWKDNVVMFTYCAVCIRHCMLLPDTGTGVRLYSLAFP